MKSFFKKINFEDKKLKNNKNIFWFTLVETIVAISISSILFMFLFGFIVDSLKEVKESKEKTQFFLSFSSFNAKMKNFSEAFYKYSFVKSFDVWVWSDIILLKNEKETFWIAIWIVNKDTMKFDNDYGKYWEKLLWYSELSQNRLAEIGTNPEKIYDYKIYKDKLFEGIYTKDFQVGTYNSNTILNLELELVPNYSYNLDWEEWKNIDKKEFFKLVLIF